jgi:hypothetical protein
MEDKMTSKYANIHEESLTPLWRERAKLYYNTTESMGRQGNISEEDVAKVMRGGIDIHCHGYPEALVDTGWDFAWEAKRAYDAGWRAIVCKSMHSDSAPMAYFLQQIMDEYAQEQETPSHPFNVYGGPVLNWALGGLNPVAVETSAKLGAKIIWMPSHDSAHHMRVLEEEGKGVELLDSNDEPLPELIEIFKIIAKYNIILDFDHTSTKERFIMAEEAPKYGVTKMLATHPHCWVNRMTIDQMVELSRMGVYLGIYFYSAYPSFNNADCDRMEVFRIIEKVGPDRIVIAPDFGTIMQPPPVEGMKLYIRLLLAFGVSEQDIRTMFVTNPSRLLGLEAPEPN